MKILRSVRSKNCADGALLKVFLLDEPFNTEFLSFLSHFGSIKVTPFGDGDLITFDQQNFISIKTLRGSTTAEVRYAAGMQDLTSEYFHLLVGYFRDNENINAMRGIETSISEKMQIRLR